jgi:molybdopterin/thiamine biosynthesis adenylyltransferase
MEYGAKKFLEKQLLSLQSNSRIVDLQLSDNKVALERGSLVVATAKISLGDSLVQIHVGLDQNFPNSLPIVILDPKSISNYIPHVEPDGFICYTEQESVVINNLLPEAVLAESVDLSIKVLERGISGENKWDFIDEFDAYWRSYQSPVLIKSLINPTENARKIVVARGKSQSDKIDLAYVSDEDVTALDFGINLKIKTRESGIYVPLQQGTFIDLFSKKTLTEQDFQEIVTGNVSPRNKKLLRHLTRKNKKEEVIVFSLPRPSGGEVLFGVQFSGINGGHPLNNKGKVEKIILLALERIDKPYLLPRGGASKILQNKKVALIGCGAVGGRIAVNLVESGLLNLTLIDPDVMKSENIFRHVLGKEHIAKHKSEALRSVLENQFPYAKVKSFAMKIEEAITKQLLDLNKFDLIVIATGDDNLSLKINRETFAKKIKTPVVYSWLEAYGIGGHVLITNVEEKGCFQCLFTSLEGEDRFINRASFALPGQSFTKDMSGCANRFTPFSALDAGATAILAVRTSLKILNGTIQNNGLLSWKGDADQFISQGFQISDRHRNFDITAAGQCVSVYSSDCRVCNRMQD